MKTNLALALLVLVVVAAVQVVCDDQRTGCWDLTNSQNSDNESPNESQSPESVQSLTNTRIPSTVGAFILHGLGWIKDGGKALKKNLEKCADIVDHWKFNETGADGKAVAGFTLTGFK